MPVHALQCLLVLLLGMGDCQKIARIDECGLTCSQALLCKRQSSVDFFNQFCRERPGTLSPSALESMKISTVMKCTAKRQCSLYLSVKGTLHLDENIRGIEICSLKLDTSQSQCVSVRLSKRKKTENQMVQVHFNCFETAVADHVYMTMKTIPNYCDVQLEQEYFVEDCRNEDIASNIPVCIAGHLKYRLDRAKKAISIHVTDFLEDQDYHVRLCRKWFSCQDIGAYALIKGSDSLKSTTLQYSELLPCLCIEGWSAFPDSRRRQICPFKNESETLWNGVVYHPNTQSLVWQPVCPVEGTINLCQKKSFIDQCLILPNSSRPSGWKVEYSQVDAHPGLCIKLTTQQGSWVRCPFARGQFTGWIMTIAVVRQQLQIEVTSQTKATFFINLHNKTKSRGHEFLYQYPPVSVDNSHSVKINVSRELCGSDICLQGCRTDVQFSIPLEICDIPCPPLPVDHSEGEGNYLLALTIIAVLLILLTFVAITGCITLAVHYRKKLENKYSLKSKVQHQSSVKASSIEQHVSILHGKADYDY
ncbi:interleukin-17 receptor E-like protein [Ambystoma mexicanum]|uniref:interleukin-17 receptor E-like protein n=1 Tax=Ambystoma mexicanum TaxID=8296 RepID=UPI0037E75A16